MEHEPPTIFTIGHSTHPVDAFLGLLQSRGIETLVDVRAFPGSRRHPHFNKDALAGACRDANISYYHMVSLGGRRKSQNVTPPDAKWRSPVFAAYAEYATTPLFHTALSELEAIGRKSRTAIMCAEALWWHCHRQIIAEELAKDGFTMNHILPVHHVKEAERSPELPGF